jgi:hypothetical protein
VKCNPYDPGATHWDGCDCSIRRYRAEALAWAWEHAQLVNMAEREQFIAEGLTALEGEQ